MTFEPLALHGCGLVRSPLHRDERGAFRKPFRASAFEALGLAERFVEVFWSASRRGVVRGLHFQAPPHAHDKLVHCVHGRVFDAVVDLRRGSPTYGRSAWLELSAVDDVSLFVPAGLAHGFCALTDGAVVVYHVTSEHEPSADTGIRWDSAGIPWPEPAPLVSARDRGFPPLDGYESPFVFEPREGPA